jgi:uncharacterized protein YlaI
MADLRKCATCGKQIDLDDKTTFKTLMDCGIHRYVCSSGCMIRYYK